MTTFGAAIRRLPSCTSTNDVATQWARQGAPHGAVVVAEEQRAGRGRLGRSWHAPPGENLTFSCVLRPQLPIAQVPPITLCAGMSVCEVVNSLGVGASIKWPNDVWVGDKKLAGVLTEMSTRSHQLEAVIVGIGLNVNTRSFPPELSATSLALAKPGPWDTETILRAVLDSLERWINLYCQSGISALREGFARYNALTGQTVRARVSGQMVQGEVIDLGQDGGLTILDASGQHHTVVAGEVHVA